MGKLRSIHVVIIGIVVCVLVAVGLYFLVIKKAIEARDAEKARLDAAIAAGGTQANVEAAERDLENAKLEVAQARVKYEKRMRTKMPNISLDDTKTGMLALWREQSEVLGPLLLNHIRSSKGIRLVSGITIPPPTVNPNDLMQYDQIPIRIDVGKVSVAGDFNSIINHLESWNKLNRLVLIDQPTLNGQSPNLVCEYTMTVFLYPMAPPPTDPFTMAPPQGGDTAGAPGLLGGPPIPAPR